MKIKLLLGLYFALELVKITGLSALSKKSQRGTTDCVENYIYQSNDKQTGSFPPKAVMIYAATVGELRAAEGLIEELAKRYPVHKLAIMPGREQYLETFARLYPEAIVLSPTLNRYKPTKMLYQKLGITLTVLVEGPSVLGRFPVFMTLAIPVACLVKKVHLVVVNACVYTPEGQGRLETVRNKLFSPLLGNAINHWYVADDAFRNDLVEAGVPDQQIETIGDIKFDAMLYPPRGTAETGQQQFMNQLQRVASPLIVAGSIKARDEIDAVIAGWQQFKLHYPGSKLVIAPRYIHEKAQIKAICDSAEQASLTPVLRTKGVDQLEQADVIVLDTYGELPHIYGIADVVFAGRNHGVLEPMRVGRPVIVGPSEYWNPEYSTSYSLYKKMKESAALIACETYSEVGPQMLKLLQDAEHRDILQKRAADTLRSLAGASNRIAEHLKTTHDR